jgi:acetylornithine deacetylase/succinyl-diaminopimelate desuccinylase-like protein
MIPDAPPAKRNPDRIQEHASAAKAQALAQASKNQALELLSALVRHQTYGPGQCATAAPLITSEMVGNGFDLEEHCPVNEAGDHLPVIIGWLGQRTRQPDILLCAHMDTSPAGGGWTREPYDAEREGGFLYGRGSVVSKSDVACFIHAARAAYHASEIGRESTIAVAITSDEGSGGDFGASYVLNHLEIRPAIAIFPGVTDVATIAHNGCVQVKVRIAGTACHQSLLSPAEDAMRRASALCSDIYALADRLALRGSATPGISGPTLNVTRIFGGTEFGMAPREVEIWIDRRVTPDEELDASRQEILEVIDKKVVGSATQLSREVVRMADPMRPSDKQDHFVRLLDEEAKAAFGKHLVVAGSTLYTDARWFSNADIPTIMYGAGEADIRVSGANGIDERVPEECLEQATVILARAMVRFISERPQQ